MTSDDAKQEEVKRRRVIATRTRGARQSKIVLYSVAVTIGSVGGAYHWGWAAAVMAVYTLIGLNVSRKDYSQLDFADSVYYLGFTYTLVMLSITLLAKDSSTSSVFAYFGTAVVTSILGIVLRSLIQLFYRTPEDTMDAANERILETIDRFIANMDTLNQKVLLNIQSVEEKFLIRLKGLQSFVEDVQKKVEEHLTAVSENAEKDVKEVRKRISSRLTGLTDNFDKRLPAIDKDLEHLSSSVSQMATNVKKANKAIAPLGSKNSSYDKLADNIKEFNLKTDDTLQAITRTLNSFDQLNTRFQKVFAKSENTEENVHRIMEEVERVLKDRLDSKIG